MNFLLQNVAYILLSRTVRSYLKYGSYTTLDLIMNSPIPQSPHQKKNPKDDGNSYNFLREYHFWIGRWYKEIFQYPK